MLGPYQGGLPVDLVARVLRGRISMVSPGLGDTKHSPSRSIHPLPYFWTSWLDGIDAIHISRVFDVVGAEGACMPKQ
jgi:hypothetical protein